MARKRKKHSRESYVRASQKRRYSYPKIECEWRGECLEVINHPGTRGYHAIHRNGKRRALHRWIFYIHNGFLPEVVMHTCDNPHCINSNHLISGTNADNSRDMVSKGRQARGKKNGGWKKLDEYKVGEIRRLDHGETLQSIADKFGVSKKMILLIKQGRKWKHVC